MDGRKPSTPIQPPKAHARTHLHHLQRVVREGEAGKGPVVRRGRPEARARLLAPRRAQVRGVGLCLLL